MAKLIPAMAAIAKMTIKAIIPALIPFAASDTWASRGGVFEKI